VLAVCATRCSLPRLPVRISKPRCHLALVALGDNTQQQPPENSGLGNAGQQNLDRQTPDQDGTDSHQLPGLYNAHFLQIPDPGNTDFQLPDRHIPDQGDNADFPLPPDPGNTDSLDHHTQVVLDKVEFDWRTLGFDVGSTRH